jgi:transposase
MEERMGKRKTPTFLHMGVDVAKGTLALAFRALDGQVGEAVFKNDDDGIRALVKVATVGRRRRRVVVEATGAYSVDLCLALCDAGVAVMVVNPLAARRFAEARLTRAKTDRVDARMLLDFAERMEFVPWRPPSFAVRQLRAFAARVQSLVEQRTAEINRLEAAKVHKSVPAVVVNDIEKGIKDLDARITALLHAAKDVIQADVELTQSHAIVTSIPGFADRSALQILAQLVALDPEMSARHVVAFAGLDPRPQKSGASINPPMHISRQGNRVLRAAMYMPTLVAVRFEPTVAAAYEALVNRGKAKKLAQVAIMRRLLCAIWRMIQTKSTWDPAKFGSVAPVDQAA